MAAQDQRERTDAVLCARPAWQSPAVWW